MKLGEILEKRRNELGLLQTDVAEAMEREGIKVTKYMITRWENEKTVPNARQFLLLCRVLGIRDVMGEFLGEPDWLLAGLNREGKARMAEYARLLRASEEFSLPAQPVKPRRTVRLYDLPVSAGPGTFLDSEGFELIELPEDAPEETSYALRVSGTSMEPYYHDGQLVWIREQNSLMNGEIGIFDYDGASYIKQLVIRDDGVTLHSLNPANEDIRVSDALPLRVMGKLLR